MRCDRRSSSYTGGRRRRAGGVHGAICGVRRGCMEIADEKQVMAAPVTFAVNGMTCDRCVHAGTEAAGTGTGAAVSLASEAPLVTGDAPVPPQRLVAAVERGGYGAKEAADRDRGTERETYARRTLFLALCGAALAIPAVVLSMSLDIARLSIF